MSRPRILVVEDDSRIRKFLRISLEANAYDVVECRLGEEALELCAQIQPELMILDLGLPDIDGQDVIRRLREWSGIPVIVLSVRAEDAEKVTALDAGADDYVTKPFSISELIARVRVLLRKSTAQQGAGSLLRCGDLLIDLIRRRVSLAGRDLALTRKEYELLRLLSVRSGHVVTHDQILREIWGPAHLEDIHYLRILVRHLRQKLTDEPSAPRYVHTVQGVGYRFEDCEPVSDGA
ncbi:MAG: response regulator transcription factor [Gammaproteobacteria bacterium]|nr:response regulator transcription factor [Gammaproteobacteria bacterium]